MLTAAALTATITVTQRRPSYWKPLPANCRFHSPSDFLTGNQLCSTRAHSHFSLFLVFNLRWRSHSHQILPKAGCLAGVLRRLRKKQAIEALSDFYRAYIGHKGWNLWFGLLLLAAVVSKGSFVQTLTVSEENCLVRLLRHLSE